VHDILDNIRRHGINEDSMTRKYWLASETMAMRLLLKMSIIKSIIMITVTWPMILKGWRFRQMGASATCHDLIQCDVPRPRHCPNNNQQQERNQACKNVSQNNDLQQERSQVNENRSQNKVPSILLLVTSTLTLHTIMSKYSMWLLMRTLVIKLIIMIMTM